MHGLQLPLGALILLIYLLVDALELLRNFPVQCLVLHTDGLFPISQDSQGCAKILIFCGENCLFSFLGQVLNLVSSCMDGSEPMLMAFCTLGAEVYFGFAFLRAVFTEILEIMIGMSLACYGHCLRSIATCIGSGDDSGMMLALYRISA